MAEFGFGIEASAAALALTLMIGLVGLSVLALAQSLKIPRDRSQTGPGN